MNTLLKVIKRQGKAVLITGGEGAGKTLLAKCLAEGSRTAHCLIEDLLAARSFTQWLGEHPEVVIVEGFVDTEHELALLSNIICADKMACGLKGQESQWVATPMFIFESYAPPCLPAGSRRFYTIELDR